MRRICAYTREIAFLEIFVQIKPAARRYGVGRACGNKPFKVAKKNRFVKHTRAGGSPGAFRCVVFRQGNRDIPYRRAEGFADDEFSEKPVKPFKYGVMMFFFHFPDIRGHRVCYRGFGIAYVEHIPKTRFSPGVVDKSNALCPAPNPTIEFPVPHIELRAGRRRRALRVYHQTVGRRVFVHASRRFEKVHPFPAFRRYVRRCFIQ
jgi:hypothetical protein